MSLLENDMYDWGMVPQDKQDTDRSNLMGRWIMFFSDDNNCAHLHVFDADFHDADDVARAKITEVGADPDMTPFMLNEFEGELRVTDPAIGGKGEIFSMFKAPPDKTRTPSADEPADPFVTQ